MSIRGWVYVIVNKAMPDLVKIGFSTKDPILRARELDNTGAPHPYEVIYDALVDSPRDIEQSVHRTLDASREGREWFRCSHQLAIHTIKSTATAVHAERRSGQLVKEPNNVSGFAMDSICWYSNCAETVARSYKGKYFCAKHYEVERRARFVMVGHDARKA